MIESSVPEFSVTFWGVRGGYPVPGERTIEFGGNTTCVQIQAGPHLIIVDSGTGIVGLGTQLIARWVRGHRPITATMLFTHGHHDHTQGLPFFEPLRRGYSRIDILGPRMFGQDLRDVLRRAMVPSLLPVALDTLPGLRSLRPILESEVVLFTEPGAQPEVRDIYQQEEPIAPDAAKVEVCHSSNHPKGGSLCYGVTYHGHRVVMATDTEGYEGGDQRLISFASGADLLIHDAEYTDAEYAGPPLTRQGWGHSTWRMAVDVGRAAKVKRLVLTHHNARHDDRFMRAVELEVQQVFPAASMAREGMTVQV
jgi:phosphoribosyl 1,2-cyclic phosphodiesterase